MSKRGSGSEADGQRPKGKRRRRLMTLGLGGLLLDAAAPAMRGYRPGNVVVRCRDGHLFTTLWIPGVSLKALRLGPWRAQRCPVGRHWSLVTPVSRAALSPGEASAASQVHDIRIP